MNPETVMPNKFIAGNDVDPDKSGSVLPYAGAPAATLMEESRRLKLIYYREHLPPPQWRRVVDYARAPAAT